MTTSSPEVISSVSMRRILLLAGLYALAYLAASWLDLWTTGLALTRPGASEGNVYATTGAAYISTKAWLITGVGGAVVEAFLLFAALNAGRVAETWLRRPVRSFAKLYVNPFAAGVIDRSPLQAMCFVIAFVPLRLLAAANNTMIWETGRAPLGELIGRASNATTPLIGFWAVMAPLFYLLAFACAPAAVRVIRWLRRG
jgi:hypothetical protein